MPAQSQALELVALSTDPPLERFPYLIGSQ